MAVFQFLYFTGARLSEIAGLQAEDLLEEFVSKNKTIEVGSAN